MGWNEYFASRSQSRSEQLLQDVAEHVCRHDGRRLGAADGRRSGARTPARTSCSPNRIGGPRPTARRRREFRVAVRETHRADDSRAGHLRSGPGQRGLGELEKARTEYRSLAEKWPQGPLPRRPSPGPTTSSNRSTKQFYDWLAKYEPPAPLSKEPGTPGARPDFLQEPDAGTLKLPSSLDDTQTPFPSLGGEPVEGASDAKSEGDAEPASPN